MLQPIRNPVGYEQLTVSTTAVGLATVPTTARHALIYIVAQALRWRADGTAPTATVGMPEAANTQIEQFMRSDGDFQALLANIKFIRSGGTDSVVEVHYFD